MNYSLDLTTDAVGSLLYKLKNYKKTIDDCITRGIRRALEEAEEECWRRYGDTVLVDVTISNPSDGEFVLSASGDEVCFLEFGTGFYTNTNHPFQDVNFGFEIVPGSWSAEHQHTFQNFLKTGKKEIEYPYNNEPRRGMEGALEVLRARLIPCIKEEISKL